MTLTTMKTMKKNLLAAAFAGVMAAGLASCSSEAPFSADGEGLVLINVDVNAKVTRATPTNVEDLKENCIIYIEKKDGGLIHKWKGVDNVPKNGLYMRYGSYIAEAWSGDSVSASFDKKFYRGLTEFYVGAQNESTAVNLVCHIANVVTSIDEATINSDLIENLDVTVRHTRGSLQFTGDNLYDKGYFMMPNGVRTLEYSITGTNKITGRPFTKTGTIDEVEGGHEYRMQFSYNSSSSSDEGGAFLTITIEEENLVQEEEVVIYGAPSFSWNGNYPAIDRQLVGTPGTFKSSTLRVAAYKGFSSIEISSDDPVIQSALGGNDFELVGMTETGLANLKSKGVEINHPGIKDDVEKYNIIFTASWLNALPERDTEYVLTVTAIDDTDNRKTASAKVRIANSEAAIEYADPVIVDTESLASDYMAVGAKYATIPLTLNDENLEDAALQYRAQGSSNWSSVAIATTRGSSTVNVKLTGLTPGTTYEYRVTVGGDNGEYDFVSDILTFATEGIFSIPNASFEEWGSYSASTKLGDKDVTLPGSDRSTTFWESGNEGAATANMTLTDKSTDMIHSGTYSARLESKAAMGIIAAGNIFAGKYVKTDGTNGVLSIGRPYNGSHPSKLKVYANYRPASGVTVKSGNEEFVPSGFKGGNDHAQIYVALTTGEIEIRTNPSNRKLFNVDDKEVLAYGEVTWTGNFGPDGALEAVEIPLSYKASAKTTAATHLVIVVSASKYGDYFSGAKGSVMYLDDFELIYE